MSNWEIIAPVSTRAEKSLGKGRIREGREGRREGRGERKEGMDMRL